MNESRGSLIKAKQNEMNKVWRAVNLLGGLDNFPLLIKPFKLTMAIASISLALLALGK